MLQHLNDIDCAESENGFKLIFHFDKNEHFDHDTLVSHRAHQSMLAMAAQNLS